MSGVVRGISRVFRSVSKSPLLMVAGVALAAGAVLFTGGAALGVGPLAGG